MGTRGLTGFVVDGEWKVTYNHFDSYPSYLGMNVLKFCKSVTDWEYLKEKVRKVVLVDTNSTPTEEQIELYKGYANLTVSYQILTDWYCLLRGVQGDGILYEIAVGNITHMIDSHTFMADSLFCEWGYVIDLDEEVLRVYKGFIKDLYPETTLPSDIKNVADSEGYYPVRELYAYSLHKLPQFMLGMSKQDKADWSKENHG